MATRKILYFFIIISAIANGSEIQYFDQKIDYWGDKPQPTKLEIKQEGKFPWKAYLDPKNKEFFKEGDYTPPEPFMEIARNPTDDNIKQWFEYMKKKNELQSRLQLRMQEYLAKNSAAPIAVKSKDEVPKLEKLIVKNQSASFEPTRYRVRMYFESTCPHCRRMFGVLKQLENSGIYVEALQIDKGPVPEDEKIVPISKAESIDIKKHNIKGVPFLLIADTKRKALLPSIEGYHEFKEVMELLKAASNTN